MIRHLILLFFGVFACSTAAIFIRNSSVHPIMLSAMRLLIAAIGLTPVFIRDWRHHRNDGMTIQELGASVLPGAILAIHFITWNMGIRMTRVANGSLIVNLVPLAMPMVLFMLTGERLTKREVIATTVAMVATTLLILVDYRLDPEYFMGDMICFGSMVFFASYLAISRRHRTSRSIWLYVVPLYTLAGIFCLITAIVWGVITNNPDVLPQWYPAQEWIWMGALGLIPTITGHSILNYCMKKLRGQVVSIVNLSQFAFAGALGWICFSEVPHWSLYVTAAILAAAVYLVITEQKSNP